jgi:hypothetical protein
VPKTEFISFQIFPQLQQPLISLHFADIAMPTTHPHVFKDELLRLSDAHFNPLARPRRSNPRRQQSGLTGFAVRMGFKPMLRDLPAPADPDAFMVEDMTHEPRQGFSAAWAACQPSMKTNRHHLRLVFPLPIKPIEGELKIEEEILA